eukprot:2114305-Karenia_brevis.AAC.1
MCGQEWAKGKQGVGGMCPEPEIWGQPQQNRPWLVTQGNNLQWGHYAICNSGLGAHRLQWYKGILYCTLCGTWTKSRGQPRLRVDTCKGKKPMGARILRAFAR